MTGNPDAGKPGRASVVPMGARPDLGLYCLVVSFLTLGTLWPLLRAGVQTMPPLWFACTRLSLAAAVMFVFLTVLRRLRLPARQDVPVLISVGVFMMGLYVVMAHIALQYVGAGRATLLGFTTPLWVTPAAVLLLRERLNAQKLLGLVMGVGGLTMLFNPRGFDWSDSDVVMGNGLMLLCAMSWAVAIIQMRTQVYRLEPYQLVPWQLTIAAGCALIGALIIEPSARIELTQRNVFIIIAAGPVIGPITLWAGTMTMRHLPAVTASVGFLGVPVVASLIAWIFMGEPLTWTLVTGGTLILAGLTLVSLGEARAG